MSTLPQGAMRWLTPALVGLLCLGLVAPAAVVAQSGNQTATTTANLNLRAGPSLADPVQTVIPAGSTVSITGSAQNGFYPVTYNGTSGWAFGDFLTIGGSSPDPPAQGGGSATTTANLNLRAGPSTADPVVSVIPAGATVTLTGQSSNGFLGVTYDGQTGWAHGDFLSTGGSTPAPAPDPPSQPGSGSGTATVTVALNLRSGPSTADSVIAVIPAGSTVTLTGNSSNGFLSVSYNGQVGWAYADYLDTGGGSTPPPSSDPGSGSGSATTTANLNLRAGPSTGDPVVTVMPAGSTVTITGNAQNGFYPVTYNGNTGWAHGDYLNTGGGSSPPPSSGGETRTVTANLNLRAGPSTSDAVIAVMPAGATVTLTGQSANGFLGVTYNGQTGWAHGDYLSTGGSGSNPPPGGGGGGIIWPVSGGTWQIIQGYNGGTHQNRSAQAQYYYALDIARVDGNTAGQPVYSPVNGRILWNHVASGGLAIDMGNGYVIAMFHCTFLSNLGAGQTVQQGQYLGTVSGPGGNGYAATPHIDMTLWQSSDGGRTRVASPFTGGNSISGMSFPDVGGWNQHNGTRFNP